MNHIRMTATTNKKLKSTSKTDIDYPLVDIKPQMFTDIETSGTEAQKHFIY